MGTAMGSPTVGISWEFFVGKLRTGTRGKVSWVSRTWEPRFVERVRIPRLGMGFELWDMGYRGWCVRDTDGKVRWGKAGYRRVLERTDWRVGWEERWGWGTRERAVGNP